MSEFFFPEYADWLPAVTRLQKDVAQQWSPQDQARLVSQPNYVTVKGLIAGPLSLPARRDYYREERASLVVASFASAPRFLFGGGVAFLVAMADLTGHLPTRRIGLELLYSLSSYYETLGLDAEVANWAKERGGKLGGKEDQVAVQHLGEECGQIVKDWLKEPGKPITLWLSERKYPSEEF